MDCYFNYAYIYRIVSGRWSINICSFFHIYCSYDIVCPSTVFV